MRRQDKAITNRGQIEAIIQKADVCRLALADERGPYIVPLNFGFAGNALYFHSAHKGRKIDILKKNPRVCFEFDLDVAIVPSDKPCSWNTCYQSVIGFGRASFVDRQSAKKEALNMIMDHYAGRSFEFSQTDLQKVTIIRVEIEQMIGKCANAGESPAQDG